MRKVPSPLSDTLNLESVVHKMAGAILSMSDGLSLNDALTNDFGHATTLYRTQAAAAIEAASVSLPVAVIELLRPIRNLHRPITILSASMCECGSDWPCATTTAIRKLEEAL